MSSWVTCPCGAMVSKNEPRAYSLASEEAERVATKLASVVASGTPIEDAFFAALTFEFNAVVDCTTCGRRLLLGKRDDAIVDTYLRRGPSHLTFVGRAEVGDDGAFEVQVFQGDLKWLRLVSSADQADIAFWSLAGEQGARWESIVRELRRRLANVASDDAKAIRAACELRPWRWDYWGEQPPLAIAEEVSSGALTELARSGPFTRISADGD